ncbi:MAG: class I tRNA ligase family protein, partial [Patescibacteria group bacterium]|nr:class I tRNA ligase family protein [Patescibacteria group bacterium]
MRFLEETFNLTKLEEKVLKFWQENNIFQKTLKLRQKQKSPKFVFYEGPPTANGRPGIHHVLARSFKDVILRYKTMRGYYVPRKAGWDTHGLPVELEVEKELGFNSKTEIEKFGIAKFNQKCKESVWKYKKEWEELTERMGFWLDFKNAYITYENSYIESLWWIIKKFFEKKLLYEGYKVVPWCLRCGTTLSSHELGQPDAYKTIIDNSVFVRFKILSNNKEFLNCSILSWTTTPWTLPGNVALAINPNHTFVKIKDPYLDNHFLVLEEESFKRLLNENKIFPINFDKKIITKINADKLIGLSYEPLFKIEMLKNQNSYKIYPADFVGQEEGTGVVHTAVMYGEEDYELGKKNNLPTKHTVLENGQFINDIEEVGGLFVVSNKIKNEETENKIFKYLEKNGFLFKILPYEHEYPHCWRCKTPILYYARQAWFVNVSKIRSKLIKNNKKINWIPEYIKDGRFGQWLKENKDWNFSRERYWGTPLPIWKCSKCSNQIVIGSIAEISKNIPKSNNTYFVMRHGESQTQIKKILDSGEGNYGLTNIGKDLVGRQAKKLLSAKIDLIFSSDILRAKQTAEIISKILGKEIIFDKRLREANFGDFSGKSIDNYHKIFENYEKIFSVPPLNGESLRDVRKRIWEFLSELESKYQNKNILIISHEYPIWMIAQSALGWDEKKAILEREKRGDNFIKTSEFIKIKVIPGPRNESGEFDLHRPYIDNIELKCNECGSKINRVKEVVDVWFDSGAMPYAQAHWPFEKKHSYNSKINKPIGIDYPADYIAEAVDQTRGWFYTLLTVSTLLGFESSYKNVVCLGLVLDKFGKKMSKSIGNVVNPWEMIEKYGIDSVRWYLYSATPAGEPKNFDPDEILKTFRKIYLILYNSFIFWKTYSNGKYLKPKKIKILDQWILNVLNQTILNATFYLDKYDMRQAILEIENLIDQVSRWYIRRSRRIFQKPESSKALSEASYILGLVLNNISKLIAPFSPFFAEGLYNETKIIDSKPQESVHLTNWPIFKGKINKSLLQEMDLIKDLSAEVLKQRAEKQIKVRQPLSKLSLNIKYRKLFKDKNKKELLEILKDEVNVKNIVLDLNQKEDIVLDTNITQELYEEGLLRDLIRIIQDLRNKANLKPIDKI